MLRVGHIADVHLGKRPYNLEERERDIYDAFREAVQLLVENGVEILLLSGDIFDTSLPPIRALKVFRDTITPLVDNGVKVFAISGDHDTPKRRDVPPIRLFDTMGVRYLWSGNPCEEAGDVSICGLQNYPATRRGNLLEKLAEIKSRGCFILMLHQGLKPYFRFGELGVEELPRGCRYYAMGHVHSYMVKDYGGSPLVYPGSLEVIDVTEVEDAAKGRKGPVLVELDGDRASVKKLSLTMIRPQIIVRAERDGYRDLLQAIEDELEKVNSEKKPLVHVYVEELPPRSEEEALLRSLEGRVLKLIFRRLPRKGEALIDGASLDSIDIHTVLAETLGGGRVLELAEELLDILGKAGDIEKGYSVLKRYYEEVAKHAGKNG